MQQRKKKVVASTTHTIIAFVPVAGVVIYLLDLLVFNTPPFSILVTLLRPPLSSIHLI